MTSAKNSTSSKAGILLTITDKVLFTQCISIVSFSEPLFKEWSEDRNGYQHNPYRTVQQHLHGCLHYLRHFRKQHAYRLDYESSGKCHGADYQCHAPSLSSSEVIAVNRISFLESFVSAALCRSVEHCRDELDRIHDHHTVCCGEFRRDQEGKCCCYDASQEHSDEEEHDNPDQVGNIRHEVIISREEVV